METKLMAKQARKCKRFKHSKKFLSLSKLKTKKRKGNVKHLLKKRLLLATSAITDRSGTSSENESSTKQDESSSNYYFNSIMESTKVVKTHPEKVSDDGQTSVELPELSVLPLPWCTSSVLLVMEHTAEVIVHGVARTTAIKGTLSVNGYELIPGNATLVAAPLTHPGVVIKVYGIKEMDLAICQHSFHESDVAFIKDAMNKWDIVILFHSVIETFDLRILPGYPDIFHVKATDVQHAKELCKGLWACQTSRCFQEYDCYASAVKKILSFDEEKRFQTTYPVVVTAGGKNAGKSTFNRYLVNRLLSRYPNVYYLECDVGQTEFTPSGQISICRIDHSNPLISPPFCHQRDPICSCYYGNNTPAGDPDRYVECIQFVASSLSESLNGCIDAPIVVNTMGWNRALGLQLLVDIIRLMQPTHIVQMFTEKQSRNIVPLTRQYITVANGWLTAPQPQDTPPRFKHIPLDVTLETCNVVKYMAPDMRNLSLLAYLSNLVQTCQRRSGRTVDPNASSNFLTKRLQGLTPYSVQMNNLVICNASDSPVKVQHASLLLNASMVGLCSIAEEDFRSLKEKPSSAEDLLHSAFPCACLGVGLVRGVKPETGTLFILSHLSPTIIGRVNCIICGTSVLPEPLQLQQQSIDGKIPYISQRFSYEVLGSGMFRVHRKFSKLPSAR